MAEKSILVNTVLILGLSVVAAGLGFFSARWMLSGLGASGLGVVSFTGSVLALTTLLNGVTQVADVRYLVLCLGRMGEGAREDVGYRMRPYCRVRMTVVCGLFGKSLVGIGIRQWLGNFAFHPKEHG